MDRLAAPRALWLCAATIAGCAAGPVKVAAAPGAPGLMDLKAAIQTVTPDNLALQLDLPAFLADRKESLTKLTVRVSRVDGAWQAGTGQGYRTPRADHKVDAGKLRLDGRRLTGALRVSLKPDGRTHKEWRSAECTIDARLCEVGPQSVWPKDDIDIRTWPYYFLLPQSQGAAWEVHGTCAGVLDGRRVGGQVSGFIGLPVRAGCWNMGTWDGGLRLDFDLGTKRRNWNYGRLAIYQFPRPRDLSGFDGLRLAVTTRRPRSDVEVSLWLREEDGSWYRLKSAVPLADASSEATILFDDFVEADVTAPERTWDEDDALDLTTISHMAIGIINPFGLGKISFTVKAIDLVKGHLAAVRRGGAPKVGRRPAPAATVKVTGKTLSINGHEVVPAGLFGGYWDLPQEFRPGCMRHFSAGPTLPPKGHTEKFHIDVWHDRYQTALPLTDPNWQANMAARARKYAQKAKEANYRAHLEIWNEPYLNWTRSLKNFQNRLFDETQAKEGGPVTARATGRKVPSFQWTREGDRWRVIDATQHTYYSTGGNVALYNDMLFTVAKAVKEVNPDVQVIVSWGFRWKADHWAAWELEYKPTIDRCIRYIDGACEHHYGGEPTALIGMYEVLAAYGKTKYDKWLYSYNTEAGELRTLPVGGRVDTPAKAATLTQYRRAIYEVRDILSCASQVPDKIRSRTLLTWQVQFRQATPVAYGFLKDLRGRLVETESNDDNVWCAASIDGTDPHAMPKLRVHRLVVALFNDHRRPRAVELSVTSPTGTTFGGGVVQRIRLDKSTYEFGLGTRLIDASGTSHSFRLTLPARSAWKVCFPLRLPRKGKIARAEVRRTQFFSPDILRFVGRHRALRTSVRLAPGVLKAARRAWLRLVVEDIAPGEAAVRVGQQTLTLPKACTAENVNQTLMVPIAPGALNPETPFVFRVNPGNFAGYRVDMTSIVLETASP